MFWQNKHGVQRQHCLIIYHPIWPHLIKMQRKRWWPAFFHDAVVEYYSRVFVSNCTLHITSMALHHSGLAPANYALEMSHLVQIKAEVVKLFGKNNHIFRGAFDFETSTWKLELLYVYRFETRQPLPFHGKLFIKTMSGTIFIHVHPCSMLKPPDELVLSTHCLMQCFLTLS